MKSHFDFALPGRMLRLKAVTSSDASGQLPSEIVRSLRSFLDEKSVTPAKKTPRKLLAPGTQKILRGTTRLQENIPALTGSNNPLSCNAKTAATSTQTFGLQLWSDARYSYPYGALISHHSLYKVIRKSVLRHSFCLLKILTPKNHFASEIFESQP